MLEINNLHSGYGKIEILKGLKINSFADLPKESFNYTYGQMKELVTREKSTK